MGSLALPTEKIGVATTIDPAAIAAGTVSSAWVPMRNWPGGLMAIIATGTLGASATLNAKLQQATSAAGAGAKDITGKAITALTQAGAGSNKQAIITCLGDDLDVANGFAFVAVSLTVATATSTAGAVVLGFQPTYGPAGDVDASSVVEIVF